MAGWVRLRLHIRRCGTYGCALFQSALPPRRGRGYALPHGEIGLDVIASVGAQRFSEHRSVLELMRSANRTWSSPWPLRRFATST